MTAPHITALPTPPSRADDPQNFATKADAFLGALPGLRTEANTLGDYMETKAGEASTSATAAAGSASTATTQAGISTTQAGISTTQAGISTTKAGEALASANAAASSYDSFDDRYLGAKSSDPTTDNDGSALLVGAIYFNTGSGFRGWNGSAWVALPAATAGATAFTPAGNVAATNVQAAIAELDSEKVATADAVSTNTADKVVKRDASGNFSAGTITANLVGNHSGGSVSATTLAASGLATLSAGLSVTGGAVNILNSTGANTVNMASSLEMGGALSADTVCFIDMHARSGGDFDTRIIRNAGVNGTFEIDALGTGSIHLKRAGVVHWALVNDGSLRSVVPGGSTLYPDFAVRSWVCADGTGTPAIKAGGNASSLTDHAVGEYTLNFGTPLPDADYAWGGSARNTDDSNNDRISIDQRATTFTKTSAGFRFHVVRGGTSASPTDSADFSLFVFR